MNKLHIEIKDLQSKLSTVANDENIVLQARLQDKVQLLTTLISNKIASEDHSIILAQIEGAGNRIAVEGRRYNEKVRLYNIKVKKISLDFPEYKTKPYFKGQ